MSKYRLPISFWLICFSFSSCLFLSTAGDKVPDIKTIVLVRHAEKATDDPSNPDLLPEGYERANRLADHFRDWNFDQIYTTKYKRCMLTVQPTAIQNRLEMDFYNVDNLFEFAEQLKQSEHESILIAGHSNTNPQLINYLIDEYVYEELPFNEYDGIYIVTLAKGKSDVKILRY